MGHKVGLPRVRVGRTVSAVEEVDAAGRAHAGLEPVQRSLDVALGGALVEQHADVALRKAERGPRHQRELLGVATGTGHRGNVAVALEAHDERKGMGLRGA